MSSIKNTSHMLMKSLNQQKVLHLIHTEEAISRVELAQKTGLSQQTVTNIVNRLLEEELVLEGKHVPLEAGSGRKRVALSVNSGSHYAIGLEIAGKYSKGSVYNFRNERLAAVERKVEKYKDADSMLQLLHEIIDELLLHIPDLSKTKGIGVSVQGLVDSKEGILLRVPGIGFLQYPLKSLLEEKYDMPVYLDNDVNLLAVHENMHGRLSSSMNNITLKFDYGIGGAILADKRLISGSTFVAGEFGHYKAFTEADAYQCLCGSKGCLTTLLSMSGLKLHTGYTLEQFIESLQAGEKQALALHKKMVDAMSLGICNLVTILNPDCILLTGRMFAALGEETIMILREKIASNVPLTSRDVTLLQMEALQDETLLAANLVIKHVFEIPSDAWSV